MDLRCSLKRIVLAEWLGKRQFRGLAWPVEFRAAWVYIVSQYQGHKGTPKGTLEGQLALVVADGDFQ
jgi:hypothetical protein